MLWCIQYFFVALRALSAFLIDCQCPWSAIWYWSKTWDRFKAEILIVLKDKQKSFTILHRADSRKNIVSTCCFHFTVEIHNFLFFKESALGVAVEICPFSESLCPLNFPLPYLQFIHNCPVRILINQIYQLVNKSCTFLCMNTLNLVLCKHYQRASGPKRGISDITIRKIMSLLYKLIAFLSI